MGFTLFSDKSLAEAIRRNEISIDRTEEDLCRERDAVSRMKVELKKRQSKARHEEEMRQRRVRYEEDMRRRREPMTVPRWVFELLSAHARKRHENIAAHNSTVNYRRALAVASDTLGREVWPCDIAGEHHGSSPTGRRGQ